MLQMVFGRSGSGKSKYVLDIAANTDPQKLVFVVPEQFTMETEKNLLDAYNVDALPGDVVTSFTKMAGDAIEMYDKQGRYINIFGKRVLMRKTLNDMYKTLKYFNTKPSKSLVDHFLSVYAEMKTSSIEPEELLNKTASLTEKSLADKMFDIAVVAQEFNSAVNEKYNDSLDDLSKLADLIDKKHLYKGMTVIIDGFHNYSAQEEHVICALMRYADKIIITACCSDLLDNDNEPDSAVFANVREDVCKLIGNANRLNVDILPHIYMKNNYRCTSDDLRFLERELMSANTYDKACEGISLYNADCIADESYLVASLIRRDVMQTGCRFRDCAVITRNTLDYEVLLTDAFARYEVPFYIDRRENIAVLPLFTLMLSVVKAAAGERREENIMRALKTGFFNVTEDDVFELENYLLLWNIRGNRVFEEYTLNPAGYEENISDIDARRLDAFNQTRVNALIPIKKFMDSVTGEIDGLKFVEALYSLLQFLNVPEKIDVQAEEYRSQNQPVKADECVHVWETAVGVLEQFSYATSNTVFFIREASELFESACDDIDIGKIPPTIDSVTVGSADRIRVNCVKHVYIIGANEGVFPATITNTGIITNKDRDILHKINVKLGGSVEYWSVEELFIAYKAITSPSETLTVIYHKTTLDDSYSSSPSVLVRMMKNVFTKLYDINADTLPICTLATTNEAAFAAVSTAENRNNLEIQRLVKQLKLNTRYRDRLDSIERQEQRYSFNNSDISEKLFGKEMIISASRFETYQKCKYEYFLKYGLRLKKRETLGIKPTNAGTFIHFILENAIKELYLLDLSKVNDNDIIESVNRLSQRYFNNIMGGDAVTTHGFVYVFNRLRMLAIAAVNNIIEELKQSEYHPFGYEVSIGKDGDIKPYTIEVNGGSISIRGSIDRVDKMDSDGKFYRVIDYKTGTKEFNLNDLYYGLNAQMLIYLFAISKSNTEDYNGYSRGGILYYPAKTFTYTVSKSYTVEKIQKDIDSSKRMNGLLLDDPRSYRGMDRNQEMKYIPVGYNSKRQFISDSLISDENLTVLSDYIDHLLEKMYTTLMVGDIAPSPLLMSSDSPECKFCDYSDMCSMSDNSKVRRIKVAHKNEEALILIKQELSIVDGGENNDA